MRKQDNITLHRQKVTADRYSFENGSWRLMKLSLRWIGGTSKWVKAIFFRIGDLQNSDCFLLGNLSDNSEDGCCVAYLQGHNHRLSSNTHRALFVLFSFSCMQWDFIFFYWCVNAALSPRETGWLSFVLLRKEAVPLLTFRLRLVGTISGSPLSLKIVF